MSLQIFDGLLVYVDTVSDQDVGGIETFLTRLVWRAGSNALTIRPPAGEGESSILFQRRSNGSTPQHGDAWSIGVVENFEVVSRGNGTNTVRLRITPLGEVRVGDGGSFFSPTINTATLKISDKEFSRSSSESSQPSTRTRLCSLTPRQRRRKCELWRLERT